MKFKFWLAIPALVLSLGYFMASCEVVDTGRRGVKIEYGKVTGEPLPEGLYFYNPLTTNIHEISVQEKKVEHVAGCFTRDTQKVDITFVLTYYPDPSKVHLLYQQFGESWDDKIILPATLSSIKDTIGKYVADDLIGKREEAKYTAQAEILSSLRERGIIATRLDFTNLDFEDAYEKAVEDKVVAVQRAQEAKNKTVEVQEKANQQVISAQAEAESMRIRSQALSQNRSLVEYEAVQRWDGKLPQYMMGNSTPFLNLSK
jgi:regulator of protease activity HflC (stomatin/prohibitin superfamily)